MEEALPGDSDVPGSARLMKIMANQATNKVSTIKLPNGHYAGTGRETLSELFTVPFLIQN
jgi:hypothetical protein